MPTNTKIAEQQPAASEPTPDELLEACKDLATAPDILGLFLSELHRSGLINEERNAKLLFLAILSRHFEEPVCVSVQGPSAGGKSFLIKKILPFFSSRAYHTITRMSDKALARWNEDMRHRVLVVYELAGIGDGKGLPIVRSLITEGHIRYLVSVPDPDVGWKAEILEFEGPTGLIMTTTNTKLHPEDETRFLSLSVSDTQEQTSQVLKAVMNNTNSGAVDVDFTEWRSLDWLLGTTDPKFCIPFANKLADMISPVSMRLKRDIARLRSIMCANAFLHQYTRDRDEVGNIIITLEDYRVVHELMADLIEEEVQATVPQNIREVVEVVCVPWEPSTETPRWDAFMDTPVKYIGGISLKLVAEKLGIDPSAASRRVEKAIDMGYIINLEPSTGRPSRLVLGEPLPDECKILPTPEELGEAISGSDEIAASV